MIQQKKNVVCTCIYLFTCIYFTVYIEGKKCGHMLTISEAKGYTGVYCTGSFNFFVDLEIFKITWGEKKLSLSLLFIVS